MRREPLPMSYYDHANVVLAPIERRSTLDDCIATFGTVNGINLHYSVRDDAGSRRDLFGGDRVFVAARNPRSGRVQGIATGSRSLSCWIAHDRSPEISYVFSADLVFVARRSRGRGIGAALFHAFALQITEDLLALARAQARGASVVSITSLLCAELVSEGGEALVEMLYHHLAVEMETLGIVGESVPEFDW